jgi:hypothetical protein
MLTFQFLVEKSGSVEKIRPVFETTPQFVISVEEIRPFIETTSQFPISVEKIRPIIETMYFKQYHRKQTS